MNTPVSFEDAVKTRLKDIVADLIPEERWQALVEKSIKDFETNTLPKIINDELVAMYKEAIKVEFAKPEWQSKWEHGTYCAGEKIKTMLVEAAPLMLAGLLGGASQQVFYSMQTQIQNSGIVRY